MDFQSLKAQIEQGRRFEVPADGATFILRLPSDHAWRVAVEAHTDEKGRVQVGKAMAAILGEVLIGWRGVTARHILPDAPEEPVDFSAAARTELIEWRTDIAEELGAAVVARRTERRARMDAARKNLPSASSGT